ncbi:MAG: helix-turn-helix domain-containing protein [Acidimicrobiales bacterium]
MTANELRTVLVDALEGATERLRSGVAPELNDATARTLDAISDPLPNVVGHVLNAEEVARLLGLSRGTVYEAMHTGEIPSLRVGRRFLVPTHALRAWLRGSSLSDLDN